MKKKQEKVKSFEIKKANENQEQGDGKNKTKNFKRIGSS